MKNNDIKTLIRSGLTGEEVGKLMIKSMLHVYKQALINPDIYEGIREPEELFSKHERDMMVDRLTTSSDIKAYNDYKNVFDYLRNTAVLYSLYLKDFEVSFLKLFMILQDITLAEIEHSENRFKPMIVTKKQYKEIKEKDMQHKLNQEVSYSEIILEAVQYYVDQYRKGIDTPYNEMFECYKNQRITNPLQLRYYWAENANGYYVTPDNKKLSDFTPEERLDIINKLTEQQLQPIWIDQREAPTNANKFDILEFLSEYYLTEIEGDDISIFAEDYPDIYLSMIDELSKAEDLKDIKKTPKECFNEKKVPISVLYDAGLKYYIDYVDTLIIDGCFGFAVLDDEGLFKMNLDEQGFYKNEDSYITQLRLFENIKSSMSDSIHFTSETLKSSIQKCYAIYEAFKILSDRINIPEVMELLEAFPKWKVQVFNSKVADLPIHIKRPDVDFNEAQKMVDSLIKPINLNELMPLNENIQKGKEAIINIDFFRGRNSLHDIVGGVATNEICNRYIQ